MTEQLAKITLEVEGPRGPDVLCEIVVLRAWLEQGQRIQVDVPKRLACSSCDGGGCDKCGRSGAFDVPLPESPLELTLPASGASGPVRLRLPGLGALGTQESEARGHLILSVRVGDQPSRGVRLCPSVPLKPTRADAGLALRILTMVLLVSLLFLFLLWFSGWM